MKSIDEYSELMFFVCARDEYLQSVFEVYVVVFWDHYKWPGTVFFGCRRWRQKISVDLFIVANSYMSSYVISSSTVQSNKCNYSATMAGGMSTTLAEEVTSQFASLHMSIAFAAAPNPITINVYGSNDLSTGGTTWYLIDSNTPSSQYSVKSINITARRVYVSIANGGSSNTVTIYTQFSTVPISSSGGGGSGGDVGTITSTISTSTSLALTRGITSGTSKIISSAVTNATISANKALRVTDTATAVYEDNVDCLVRLSTLPSDLGKYSTGTGSTSIVSDAAIIVNGDTASISRVVQFTCPVVDNSSVISLRGTIACTPGTGGVGNFSGITFGHIGVGTSNAEFGVWYNLNGATPGATLITTVGASATSTVTVTLAGVAYVCNVTGTNANALTTSYDIAMSFNTLNAPWVAIQQGTLVKFYGLTQFSSGTIGVTTTDPTYAGVVTSNPTGSAPTWTFIPRTSFNVDRMTDWVAGDIVTFEIVVVGADARVSVVDRTTKEMKDVHVFSAASPFYYIPEYHMVMSANGVGASCTIYNASINAIKGTTPTPTPMNGTIASSLGPTRGSVRMSSTAFAYAGTVAYPIAMIVKRPEDLRPVVLKKIIIDCAIDTRVTLIISGNSMVSGTSSVGTLTATPRCNILTYPYSATPATALVYVPVSRLYSENIAGRGEVDLNMPLDIFRSIMLTLRSDDYTPTMVTYWLVFDEY